MRRHISTDSKDLTSLACTKKWLKKIRKKKGEVCYKYSKFSNIKIFSGNTEYQNKNIGI
jgi:hypothetical protein